MCVHLSAFFLFFVRKHEINVTEQILTFFLILQSIVQNSKQKKMSEKTKKRKFEPDGKSTLDRIAAVVERTEETAKSQSSKLEFLETALRETKSQITETALRAAVQVTDGQEGGTVDRAQVEYVIRDEIRRIEEKIEQVKSISCSLIEEVSESNKSELQTVQDNLQDMIMSIEDKMMDMSMNHRSVYYLKMIEIFIYFLMFVFYGLKGWKLTN